MLKSATAMYGVLSAMIFGAPMMLWLCAVSLDILLMVCIMCYLLLHTSWQLFHSHSLTTTNHVGAVALYRATFGQGSGRIWLDNVACSGSETRLIDCPANAIGSHNCVHSEDAGVRCSANTCE